MARKIDDQTGFQLVSYLYSRDRQVLMANAGDNLFLSQYHCQGRGCLKYPKPERLYVCARGHHYCDNCFKKDQDAGLWESLADAYGYSKEDNGQVTFCGYPYGHNLGIDYGRLPISALAKTEEKEVRVQRLELDHGMCFRVINQRIEPDPLYVKVWGKKFGPRSKLNAEKREVVEETEAKNAEVGDEEKKAEEDGEVKKAEVGGDGKETEVDVEAKETEVGDDGKEELKPETEQEMKENLEEADAAKVTPVSKKNEEFERLVRVRRLSANRAKAVMNKEEECEVKIETEVAKENNEPQSETSFKMKQNPSSKPRPPTQLLFEEYKPWSWSWQSDNRPPPKTAQTGPRHGKSTGAVKNGRGGQTRRR